MLHFSRLRIGWVVAVLAFGVIQLIFVRQVLLFGLAGESANPLKVTYCVSERNDTEACGGEAADCRSEWTPPSHWFGHEWRPEGVDWALVANQVALLSELVCPEGFRRARTNRSIVDRDAIEVGHSDKRTAQQVNRALSTCCTWNSKNGKYNRSTATLLQSVWKDDEFEETESNLAALAAKKFDELHFDWHVAVSRLKQVFEDAQRFVKFTWVLDEGTLLASLRWGMMWGRLPGMGLDLVDDDIDIIVLAASRSEWMNIATVLARLSHNSGAFDDIDFDPIAEQFGKGGDNCGVLQLSYLDVILVDIKVVLMDAPMTCLPCRLHPAASQSPLCNPNLALTIARGMLHGVEVPVQPLSQAMAQFALHRYWSPSINPHATLDVILPRNDEGLKRHVRSFSLTDVLYLKRMSHQLCKAGAESFAPIFAGISETNTSWTAPGAGAHDDLE